MRAVPGARATCTDTSELVLRVVSCAEVPEGVSYTAPGTSSAARCRNLFTARRSSSLQFVS